MLISLRTAFSLYVRFIDYGQVLVFMVFTRNQLSQHAHNSPPSPSALPRRLLAAPGTKRLEILSQLGFD